MGLKQFFERALVLPMALLLVGAAPVEQIIPLPSGDGEALIVPTASPVKFRQFYKQDGEYVGARFGGRFVLTGSFTWGCEWDCNDGVPVNEKENFALRVVPDPALAARLPHWKNHQNDIVIFVSKAKRFTHAITTQQQRLALTTGKLPNVQGRIAIVVDNFDTSLDCDSANYSADYVALAKSANTAKVNLDGDFGCG